MAFTNFEYSKSWRNADDFATYENDETQVREDMQILYDEVRDALNKLMSEIKAGNIPFTPTAGVDSADIQNAIENVQAQIAQTISGELPNDSVSAAKLKADSVITAKLADKSVTQTKLAEKAVAEASMDDNSVSTRTVVDGSITREKMAEDAYSDKADLVSGKVKAEQRSQPIVMVGSSRDLALTDAGGLLLLAGTDLTLTIPTNSVVSLPIGTEITLYRSSASAVTLTPAEGVTIQTPGGRAPLGSQYTFARLKKLQANLWACEALDLVKTADIADGAVTNAKLSNGAVSTGKIVSSAVTEAKIAGGAVTVAKVNSDARTQRWEVSVSTTWVGDAAPYTQSIAVSGMLATDVPKVYKIAPASVDDVDDYDEEFSKLYHVESSADSITLYAKEQTTAGITVAVEVNRI
jgi:hypothetical protein